MRARALAGACAAAALAALAAACPSLDFENHSFACSSDLDCRYTAGEECIDGHCLDCGKGLCPGLDAGHGAPCTDSAQCWSGRVCALTRFGPRCVPGCTAASDCGGLVCKVAKAQSGGYLNACAQQGTVPTGESCGASDECVAECSCIDSVCRETCYPTHTSCANVAESCALSQPDVQDGWGWCR